MATIDEINENNFENIVLKSKDIVVVDFYAQWCGPCRKLAPVLEQLQNEFAPKVKFVKIDTDKNINCAKEYGISSVPTLFVFKNGEIREMMTGLVAKSAIVGNIKKHLNA